MRKSWLVSALLLILVMLLTFVSSAPSAPRVIPANDNFVNAKPIKIGKNNTVIDIDAAAVEAGQPSVTSCGSATVISRSVWFSVYRPTSSQSNSMGNDQICSNPAYPRSTGHARSGSWVMRVRFRSSGALQVTGVLRGSDRAANGSM